MLDKPNTHGNVCTKGKPTANDLAELSKFAELLKLRAEGKEYGLSQRDAYRYAAMEVYGNEYAE